MRKLLALVLIANLATVACGSSGQPTHTPYPKCSIIFASGAPTPTGDFVACTDDQGREVLVALLRLPCNDGSTLVSSGYGWGIANRTWTYSYKSEDSAKYGQGLGVAMAICRPGFGNPSITPSAGPAVAATAPPPPGGVTASGIVAPPNP